MNECMELCGLFVQNAIFQCQLPHPYIVVTVTQAVRKVGIHTYSLQAKMLRLPGAR